ncbi:MAG TPA: hypothetical protein VGJ07_19635 [Rugosimonospora sp.]
MLIERTSVGLDVDARSIVACGLDTVTGQVLRLRLVPSPESVLGWLRELPVPVAAAYEAGPTGFDLAPQSTSAGVRCVVAAPSKLQRPNQLPGPCRHRCRRPPRLPQCTAATVAGMDVRQRQAPLVREVWPAFADELAEALVADGRVTSSSTSATTPSCSWKSSTGHHCPEWSGAAGPRGGT